jgi:hypothetical protein
VSFKIFGIIFCTVLLFTTTFATVVYAQASSGENGGNAQSPAQVIVQIIVTGLILKGLDRFKLP